MWIHMKSYICMDPSPFDVFADDLGQVFRDTHLRIKFWIRVPIAATCRMQSGSAKANLGILSGLCCFAVCFGTRSIRHRSIKWFYHVLSLLEDDHFLLPACAYSRPGCITEGEYGKKKKSQTLFLDCSGTRCTCMHNLSYWIQNCDFSRSSFVWPAGCRTSRLQIQYLPGSKETRLGNSCHGGMPLFFAHRFVLAFCLIFCALRFRLWTLDLLVDGERAR